MTGTIAKAYSFDVAEARSFSHPVFPGVQKHTFLIQANKLPNDLPTGANARDPVGMNRRVYRDVTESLRGNEAWPGSFDLMNLGITILANKVEMIQKGKFNVFIRDEEGIVNGAHTAKIIEACQSDGTIPHEQYVEVRIVTGIDNVAYDDLRADIAKGQNTAIAVKNQSIYEIQGVFDSIKAQIRSEPWANAVAWKESDPGEIDVRDLIGALEALNVVDFPNDGGSHPIHAYEKWSTPLEKFAKDFRTHSSPNASARKYAALESILTEALCLYDTIRHDFRALYNEHVSAGAGRLRIMEEAPKNKKFQFPFSQSPASQYRLTKGATYPIFSAFRNCVRYDAKKNRTHWLDGFDSVQDLWGDVGPELVKETAAATRDIGRLPDQLGKSRNHWANLHRTVEVYLLRRQLKKK